VDIKKELSKYSKDEIIGAISKVMIPGYTLDNIFANAKAIKLDNLQKKSDEAFKKMIDVKTSKDMAPKKMLEALVKRKEYAKRYKRYESEIYKLLYNR